MSGAENPDSAAFDVEAERFECPLKIPTSTPEILKEVAIHQKFSIFLITEAIKTHKLLSFSKEWKMKEGDDFPFFHALWSLWKMKVKLLGVFTMNRMFKCCKPSAREADVRAINIVNL